MKGCASNHTLYWFFATILSFGSFVFARGRNTVATVKKFLDVNLVLYAILDSVGVSVLFKNQSHLEYQSQENQDLFCSCIPSLF